MNGGEISDIFDLEYFMKIFQNGSHFGIYPCEGDTETFCHLYMYVEIMVKLVRLVLMRCKICHLNLLKKERLMEYCTKDLALI